MECYKLIIQKNSRFVNYTFSARDEDDKNTKLKAWKSENITPYDKVKLLFLGTIEEQNELIYKQICLD
jgi:putative IMPACT (imprinted ancient) family translation regulator